MSLRRRLFLASFLATSALLALPAIAQTPPATTPLPPPGTPAPPPPTGAPPATATPENPVSAAQTLFLRASEKLDRRDFTAACPMLEEVLRLEPGANGARLVLAECHEGAGRLASAHRTYAAAAEIAARLGQTERQQVALTRAAALRPRLGAVIVQVAPVVGVIPGLSLSVCGEPLPEADRGKPTPADRGPCKVVASAPGRATWEQTVQIADGATSSVTIDRLALTPRAPDSPSQTPAPPSHPPPPATDDRSHRNHFGAFLRVDVDVLSGGAVTVLGGTFAPLDHLEFALSGLLGRRAGFELAATGYLLKGAVKPFLNVGAPVLFEGDAYIGVRGGAGVQWDMHPHLGVFFSIGGTFFPDVPKGYSQGVLLPAFGVQGRL